MKKGKVSYQKHNAENSVTLPENKQKRFFQYNQVKISISLCKLAENPL